MSSLRAYILALRTRYPQAEPASLIASFLILHELTAIVPLGLGFFGLRWAGIGESLVGSIMREAEQDQATAEQGATPGGAAVWARHKLRSWIIGGEDMATKVGRRYGILGFAKETAAERDARRAEEKAGGALVNTEPYKVGGDVANFLVAYVAVKVRFILGQLMLASPADAPRPTCAGAGATQDRALGQTGTSNGEPGRVEAQVSARHRRQVPC